MLAAAATAVVFAMPFAAGAVSLEDLQNQVASLLKQISQMQGQASVITGTSVTTSPAMPSSGTVTVSSARFCPHIARSLSRGMSGDDVSNIQAFLSVQQTGYFGPLTANAVAKFQTSEGLPAIGIVGPMTRAAFGRHCGQVNGNFSATPTTGSAPLTVSFTAGASITASGLMVDYGDGTSDLMTKGSCIGIAAIHKVIINAVSNI